MGGKHMYPFVRGRVPVHFAHGAGLDGYQRGGEAACDGEGLRVEDLDGAAGDAVGLSLTLSKIPRLMGE